jgi:ABC-type nitrate/sulfonate/bicarbonate transport system substrate-binding protein
MNPGQACLNCHSGKKQPTITFGGTLFNSATGGSAVSGATVTVTDTNGKVVSVVTGPTGNFYTSDALVFPATVQISKCPDTVSMVAAAASGDCNSCHTSAKQIHLP